MGFLATRVLVVEDRLNLLGDALRVAVSVQMIYFLVSRYYLTALKRIMSLIPGGAKRAPKLAGSMRIRLRTQEKWRLNLTPRRTDETLLRMAAARCALARTLGLWPKQYCETTLFSVSLTCMPFQENRDLLSGKCKVNIRQINDLFFL